MNAAATTIVSAIVPCYNEKEVIEETFKRLKSFCDQLENLDVELIFVDDGSRDRTRELLKGFAENDSLVRVIGFARNFRHQVAVSAGIDAANGDAVVLIDTDLQDPPEVVLEMIGKWRERYDVVYGTRTERPGESAFKLATARAFYRILNQLSDIPIPLDTGYSRLMSRPVADTLRAMPERDRFIRGMVSWVGFKQIALPYRRAERFAGESKYPLRKMILFATDGIMLFSTKPLQISVGLGMTCARLSIMGIIYALALRIFTDMWVEGWTALMIAVLLIGGVQLISFGMLSEYVGRIYNEIKWRFGTQEFQKPGRCQKLKMKRTIKLVIGLLFVIFFLWLMPRKIDLDEVGRGFLIGNIGRIRASASRYDGLVPSKFITRAKEDVSGIRPVLDHGLQPTACPLVATSR